MGLQVWLPLNGNLNNQGLSNIILSGSPSSWGTAGKIGCCATFTGDASKVIYNNTTDFNYTDNFSWCIWVNTNYTGTTAQYVFTNGRADAGGYGYGMSVPSTSACSIRFGSAGYSVAVTGGEWTHIAFTKSGTTIKIYKNGTLYSTNTFSGTLPTYSDGNGLGLGCFHYSSNIYPYYGSINDFRIYDEVLSEKQIHEISKGLILHYPLNQTNITNNIIVNWHNPSSYSVEAGTLISEYDNSFGNVLKYTTTAANQRFYYSVSNVWNANQVYTVSFFAKSNTNGATMDMSRSIANFTSTFTLSTEWKKYVGYITSTATATGGTLSIRGNTSGATYYIHSIKLEIGNNPNPIWTAPISQDSTNLTIIDYSGYNNNSTFTSALDLNSDTPRYNNSTKFGNNYIISNNYSPNFLPKGTITVAWWGYMSSWSGYNRAISCTEGGGWNFEPNSSYMSFPVYQAGVGYINVKDNTLLSGLAAGWHHWAATFDRTNIKMYRDGNLTGTYTSTATGDISYANNKLIIGGEASDSGSTSTGSAGMNGCSMSDVRIYATALSADDIKELYNTAASVDNQGNIFGYEFNELGNNNQLASVDLIASGATITKENGMIKVVSAAGSSSWGTGVRIPDATCRFNYGETYVFACDILIPTAHTINLDFNNTRVDGGTNWGGNDNDNLSLRKTSSHSIAANTWTTVWHSTTNSNANNTEQIALYDYSNLGLVTTDDTDSTTWYIRNPRWYIINSNINTNIVKTGIVNSQNFDEGIKASIYKESKHLESNSFTEI